MRIGWEPLCSRWHGTSLRADSSTGRRHGTSLECAFNGTEPRAESTKPRASRLAPESGGTKPLHLLAPLSPPTNQPASQLGGSRTSHWRVAGIFGISHLHSNFKLILRRLPIIIKYGHLGTWVMDMFSQLSCPHGPQCRKSKQI